MSTKHPKYLLSGAAARRFRRELSQAASGRKDHVILSHKFPLVTRSLDRQARDKLREEYRVSSAVAENTLFHFFAAFHLSGFRVFTSINAAELHKNARSLRQSALAAGLQEHFKLSINATQRLLDELAKGIRAGNQNEQGLVTRLERAFSAELKEAGEHSQLQQFLGDIARHIAAEKLWAPGQKVKRWETIIAAGKALKIELTLPSLPPYDYCVLWDDAAREYLQGADFSADGLEFAMHQMVSLAAHIARKNGAIAEDKIKETHIKEALLSDAGSYNGLDWLFNDGMAMFARPEKEQQETGLWFGECLPANRQALRDIAAALSEKGYSYKKHRSLFGGNISSGVSNYWKRLRELQGGLDSIALAAAPNMREALEKAARGNTAFENIISEFEQIALPLEEFEGLIKQLISEKSAAQEALQRLTGGGQRVAGRQEVETIEGFNDLYEEVKGLFIQLAEKLRAKADDKKKDFRRAKALFEDLAFLLPKAKKADDETADDGAGYLKRKINRYRGAQVFTEEQINAELKQDQDKLAALQQARAEHWRRIESRCSCGINDIIAARERAEEGRFQNHRSKKAEDYKIPDLACRNILQRLANAVSRLGDMTVIAEGMKLFEKHQVFKNAGDARAFFDDKKGRLYISPFASYRHEPLKLGKPFAGDIRSVTAAFITDFFAWAEQTRAKTDSAEKNRDAALLEQTVYALRSGSIMEDIPATLARPEEEYALDLPVSLRQALAGDAVNAGQLARIFNAYASEINGLCARLAREHVIVKSRLQHIGDNDFYYAPKAGRDWAVPHNLNAERSSSALARGWRLLQTEPALFIDEQPERKNAGIKADALPLAIEKLATLRQDGEEGEAVFRACLRQMPHNWYYKNTEYRCLAAPEEETGFPRPLDDDNKIVGLWRLERGLALKPVHKRDSLSADYLRLSGASAHKGWLDDALLGKASFGDSSLIIEEEYRRENGRFVYDRTRLEAAAVFKFKPAEPPAETPSFPLAGRFIAIDLGERGIGYAVYDVPAGGNGSPLGEPAAIGHAVLPILRRLMRKVDTYRRYKQPRQRFQSNLNPALQQMREAAIGELAGTIDALMHEYQAFPVFESTVGGFESGGKMLKMVYGSILQRYTYSDVDAHKAKRQNHWQASGGAPMWKHPTLQVQQRNEKGKPAGATKPLSLFPGAAVSPAGTSQTCSRRCLNPLQLIKDQPKGSYPLSSDAGGVLTLQHGEEEVRIYIFGNKFSPARKNENRLPGLDGVLRNEEFKNADDLYRHVKNMLRHKPLAAGSRDTSQSSYLSPFAETQTALNEEIDAFGGAEAEKRECRKRSLFRRNGLVFMHADVNAAVNIGRKWWEDKILAADGEKAG